MSSSPFERARPKPAAPELLLLQKWEEFTGWFLGRTSRFPKNLRFTLTQRLENHALDVTELLVLARYRRESRRDRLDEANLLLERMRFLLRLALERNALSSGTFEGALRRLDEAGRMLHGWRRTEIDRSAPRSAR
jgi:hypothetical protein